LLLFVAFWRTHEMQMLQNWLRGPSMMIGLRRWRPLSVVALLAQTQLATAGDAAHGEVVARRWCAACHLVAADQTTAKVDAPPFSDIARRRPERKALESFLADPHPKMPDMNLSRREIADIVSYIRSLAPTAPSGGSRGDDGSGGAGK
jgi:mono/diheme cytochrome c family protein